MSLADRTPVAVEDRQEQIVVLLDHAGRVEVSDLAERLAVSEETIRRDLTALEKQGRLVRAHGGAVSRGAQSGNALTPNDRAFYRRVAEELPPQGLVYIDGDGPLEQLLTVWPAATSATIVTPSIDFAMAASLRPELDVVSLGGEASADGALSGDWALQMLRSLHLGAAIIFTESVTSEGECRARLSDAPLRTLALRRAERTILAVRETTTDPQRARTFASLAEADCVILGAAAASTLPTFEGDQVIVTGTPAPTSA